MEPTTQTNHPRRIMGEKKLTEQHLGRDLIDYCTASLEIRPTMLAALLNVTERTLNNWNECSFDDRHLGKLERLNALYKIICKATDAGISGKVILNILNEPILGDEEQKTLMYYVVDEPTNKLLMMVAAQVINSFK